MKKFLTRLAAFAAIQFLLVGLWLGLGFSPSRDLPFYDAINAKHELLAHAPSPRVIFVGGSNVFFGLDGDLIDEQTDYHPINMGLIGALRLKYMLAEVEAALRPRDRVVIALEYPQYYRAFEDSRHSTIVLGRVLLVRPSTCRFWNAAQWKAMLDRGLIATLGEAARTAGDNLAAYLKGETPATHEPLINAYGDLTLHRDRQPMKHIPPPFKVEALRLAPIGPQVAALNAFIQRCADRDVRVIHTYPPIPQPAYDGAPHALATFDRRLRKILDCPMPQHPGDMVFPRNQFYNTSYHLTGAGVPERTQRMIDIINQWPTAP